MIEQFQHNTALLIIDAQKGINDLKHWGGSNGRRNNPDAEKKIQELAATWRAQKGTVIYTQHDSREAVSPLKISQPGGAFLDGLQPMPSELVIWKDVNSGFVGTNLEIELRRRGIQRLVVTGYFTNFCVETTVRMAGNLGFDTYLAHDACATSKLVQHSFCKFPAPV
jgi:nicotinamidase-related amidase